MAHQNKNHLPDYEQSQFDRLEAQHPTGRTLPEPLPGDEWDMQADLRGDAIMHGLYESMEQNDAELEATEHFQETHHLTAHTDHALSQKVEGHHVTRGGLSRAIIKRHQEITQNQQSPQEP